MDPFGLCSPHTLELACRALAGCSGRPIAGGTDLIPQMRAARLAVERLVDLSRLHDLRYIVCEDGMPHIAALTTFAAMLCSPLLRERAPALAQAAALVGAGDRQRRRRGNRQANHQTADRARVPAWVMICSQPSVVDRHSRSVARPANLP